MKKYELDLFKDEKVLKSLVLWNSVITIASIVPFYALERLFTSQPAFYNQLTFSYVIWSIIAVILGSILIIVFHELIHGIFFKLFSPSGRVKYGYKDGMFYATAPGEIYNRKQFAVIILMPFIILTLLLLLCLYFLNYTAVTVILIFHTGACAGDFYFIYLILKYKNLKYIEDTERGITMYEKRPS